MAQWSGGCDDQYKGKQMKKSIKKRYQWKVLTDDGLLKEPEPLGSHYSPDEFNPYHSDGFESEEDARIRLFELDGLHEFCVPSNLVLITVYSVVTD